MIAIGTNPIAWSNDDDHSLGAHIPLEQCLREAEAIGFDGIERGHKMPSDPAILGPILSSHDLELVSAWHSTHVLSADLDAEVQALQRHLGLLTTLGCRVCIVCETSQAVHSVPDRRLSQRPRLRDNDWVQFGRNIDVLAEVCRDANLQLVYHHHMGTVVQTRQDIDALLQHTSSSTGLLLDTGHAHLAGANPADIANDHAARIKHVHLKNVRDGVMREALDVDYSFLKAVKNGVFTVPGDQEGCVDFDAVLQCFAQSRYCGWLVIEAEQDPSEREPLRYQKMGYEYVSQMVEKVALTRAPRPGREIPANRAGRTNSGADSSQ